MHVPMDGLLSALLGSGLDRCLDGGELTLTDAEIRNAGMLSADHVATTGSVVKLVVSVRESGLPALHERARAMGVRIGDPALQYVQPAAPTGAAATAWERRLRREIGQAMAEDGAPPAVRRKRINAIVAQTMAKVIQAESLYSVAIIRGPVDSIRALMATDGIEGFSYIRVADNVAGSYTSNFRFKPWTALLSRSEPLGDRRGYVPFCIPEMAYAKPLPSDVGRVSPNRHQDEVIAPGDPPAPDDPAAHRAMMSARMRALYPPPVE